LKVVILAGGLGTRLSEETEVKPKPMIDIGGKPILWHIMKIYSHFGYNEFIICLGYKGYYIKEYFAHYFLHQSDVTFDFMNNNEMLVHYNKVDPWKVTLIDTGLNTMTGGRVKRVRDYIGNERFMMTYGDGVGDINIPELLKHHEAHKSYATLTSMMPQGRFGALEIDEKGMVTSFLEKPKGDGNYINGGFFVLEARVFDYIFGDNTIWEREPLEKLAGEHRLSAYAHLGFWQPMDTLRDKKHLEELWDTGKAPWKLWED